METNVSSNNRQESPNPSGLSAAEQTLIAALRSGDGKDITKALLVALDADLPTPAPVPLAAPAPEPAKKRIQPEIDRQFACFLFGTMALDGCLTPAQTEDTDKIEWIIGALTKGMRASVPGWTFGSFKSLQDMYDCAEWCVTDYRQYEQDKAGDNE